MKILKDITANLLAQEWAAKKARRGFDATSSEVSAVFIDGTAQESADNFHVYTNVVPLFPFQHGGLQTQFGISNAGGVELKTGRRALKNWSGDSGSNRGCQLGRLEPDRSATTAKAFDGDQNAYASLAITPSHNVGAPLSWSNVGASKSCAPTVETPSAIRHLQIAAPNHGKLCQRNGGIPCSPEPCADIIGG